MYKLEMMTLLMPGRAEFTFCDTDPRLHSTDQNVVAKLIALLKINLLLGFQKRKELAVYAIAAHHLQALLLTSVHILHFQL